MAGQKRPSKNKTLNIKKKPGTLIKKSAKVVIHPSIQANKKEKKISSEKDLYKPSILFDFPIYSA